MSDILEVNNLHLRTCVGFSAHELDKLQEINITLKIATNTSVAGEMDAVEYGVDIKPLCKEIIEQVEGKKYQLIETVARDVAYIVLLHQKIKSVEVKIEKLNAIRFSKYSAITINRKLSDFPSYNVVISIGSNIDPERNIPLALSRISERIGKLRKISHCYQTTAIDSSFAENPNERQFHNLAVDIDTYLEPNRLKIHLKRIEEELGRVRDAKDKFKARTIDLDVSFYVSRGKNVQDTWLDVDDIRKFAHVAVPLADVKPDLKHEELGSTSIFIVAQCLTKAEVPSTYFPKVDLKLPKEMEQFKMAAFGSNNEVSNNETYSNGYENGIESKEGIVDNKDSFKVALITGGASKIGQKITRRLHSRGYNVAIQYCNSKDTAETLTNELNSTRKNSAVAIQTDFSACCQDNAKQLVTRVIENWNRLDVLVNNASVFSETKLTKCSERVWDKTLNINLSTPFFLIQAATKYLVATKGCVVNICDIHGERPLQNHSVYSISKSGLIALTKSMAKELGVEGVRVNGVSPGAISWVEGKHCDHAKQDILSKTALKRMGSTSDVCDCVDLVITCSYITGQIINVDGGRTLSQ